MAEPEKEAPEIAEPELAAVGGTLAKSVKNLSIIVVSIGVIAGGVLGMEYHFATAEEVKTVKNQVADTAKASHYQIDQLLKSQYEEKLDDLLTLPEKKRTDQQRAAVIRLQRKVDEITDRWKGYSPP